MASITLANCVWFKSHASTHLVCNQRVYSTRQQLHLSSLRARAERLQRVNYPAAGRPHTFLALRNVRVVLCQAKGNDATKADVKAAEATSEDSELFIEQQMRKNKKKKDKKGPKVIAPLVDQTKGGMPLTPVQELETNIIRGLFALFSVILLMGVFLAGSGFLSDKADQFAADVVYPVFSPTVIFFLLCSSAYGYWKTRSGPPA